MNKFGRRRFQTAELMQDAVDLYFLKLEVDDSGEPLHRPRKPTLTGLARELGFSRLSSLKNYEGYPDQDFKWVLDMARMRVMEWVEANGKSGFDVFHLKNLDPDNWKDKTEQEIDQRTKISEAPDQKVLMARLRAQLEEKQLNAIPGEATAVEEDDDSWM